MGSIHLNCSLILLIYVSIFSSVVVSAVISDSVFGSTSVSSERRLLQAKKSCPVNFESMNYTALTSKCKGPSYEPKPCCCGFKEVACPYADEINDLSTDCASAIFSYINIAGKYPAGLFSTECREGKLGFECPPSPPSANETSPNHSNRLVCGLLVALMSLTASIAFSLNVM